MGPRRLTPLQIVTIRFYLGEEKTSEWIQNTMRVTRQQVAAVKAHMTRGTYG